MVQFRFTVNKPFLTWPSHPITVPKSQVDYARLEAEGLDRGSMRVKGPDGSTLGGQMYSGKAGFGFYYQIRIDVPDHHPLLDLHIGTRLLVDIDRSATRLSASLQLL